MWWLSFRDGTAVIMRATSLLHARMLAAIHKIGFVSQSASGYQLSFPMTVSGASFRVTTHGNFTTDCETVRNIEIATVPLTRPAQRKKLGSCA